MVTVSLLDRVRTRDRARPRPNAPGNYITDVRIATVFSLTFSLSPENYIKWWPYVFPETKAIGYIDNPTIQPIWIPVGPVNAASPIPNITGGIIPGVTPGIQPPPFVPITPLVTPTIPTFEIPAPIPSFVAPIPVPEPGGVPSGATIVAQTGLLPGNTGTFTPGISPSQLFLGIRPIRRVTILAPSSNAGTIHLGYDTSLTTDNSFPLVAGSAKDLFINDLSKLYMLAENATDVIHFEYEI